MLFLSQGPGVDVDALPGVMAVSKLINAALVGFDRREPVTIPLLPDAYEWSVFDAARWAMLPNFAQNESVERYQPAA